ncbi:MAG: nucleotidyl transferase AbiEii/AbiGii toxin family protein, partial [Pseudomonadota bacterium]
GLWRAKFFEKAAFYGGSALRILYSLNRFSEDLDFSLLTPTNEFDLTPYNKAITNELAGFGFEAMVNQKIKPIASNIESAFIKADSKKQLIKIQAPKDIVKNIHPMQTIKIKMEVDTNPPGEFQTETKFLLQLIPFSIKTFVQADLFAGKIHAILCRPWVIRVKGRDWYDFVWYISQNIPVNLNHLKQRLIQSSAWPKQKKFNKTDLKKLLKEKIQTTDFTNAKADIYPFIAEHAGIKVWSEEFFLSLIEKLQLND